MIEEIQKLKDYIYPDNKYSNIHSNSILIRKYFPKIYEDIKDNYHTKLYMLCNNLTKIPRCLNINCNNHVKLENIGAGFRKFCSNKCIGEYQKTDKYFASKIAKTHKIIGNDHLNKKYTDLKIECFDNDKNRNYYIIKNYCKHGDIKIYNSTFKKLYKIKECLCEKCNEEIMDSFIISEDSYKDQLSILMGLKHNDYVLFEKNIKIYYPKLYNCIKKFSEKYDNTSWVEEIYMFEKGLNKRPICDFCKKEYVGINNYLYFNYTNHCNNKECRMHFRKNSKQQLEIYNFLLDILNTNLILNHKVGNKEINIYIPDKNIGIEFNGLYWHSTHIRKDSKYHFNKLMLCQNSGIQLINIWEDDWDNKQEIVKSIILNKLGKSSDKIYARKCLIKEISSKENIEFFNKNHLQGGIAASTKIGLFYEDKLVSCMTFGKKRSILGQKSADNEYELLRFANLINTNVIGGASKLLSYFLKNYNPSYIVSYANCDISDGNLYKILGFNKVGHTGLNYWWANNKNRYHRSNFMKHKLIKQGFSNDKTEEEIMVSRGYFKIYGTGNLKYEWLDIKK